MLRSEDEYGAVRCAPSNSIILPSFVKIRLHLPELWRIKDRGNIASALCNAASHWPSTGAPSPIQWPSYLSTCASLVEILPDLTELQLFQISWERCKWTLQRCMALTNHWSTVTNWAALIPITLFKFGWNPTRFGRVRAVSSTVEKLHRCKNFALHSPPTADNGHPVPSCVHISAFAWLVTVPLYSPC